MALDIELSSSLLKKKHRQPSAAIHWEIVADNLSKAGWTWGCVSAVDASGRTIRIADAHRDDTKRFVVHADVKLSAFVELERVSRESLRFPNVE